MKDDIYSEDLVLSTLNGGTHISATFRFRTLSLLASSSHFVLFPRPWAQIMNSFSLRELDVTLTRGLWREQFWGFPSYPAPPGASVSALFQTHTKDVDSSWGRLTNALSGQLCASLNFMDSTQTISPKLSFQPRGVSSRSQISSSNSSHFRFGTLPGENVCTENLTPWKKLLPCESKRGLPTLLNARNVHDTNYLSLGVSIRPICKEATCTEPLYELNQHITLVYDLEAKEQRNWSLRSIFGMGLASVCPLASSTSIYISSEDGSQLNQASLGEKVGEFTRFDVKLLLDRGVYNIIAHYPPSSQKRILSRPPLLHATRYLTGYGQEKGGIVTRITNNSNKEHNVVFLDVIPWFLRVYSHTLAIKTSKGKSLQPKAMKFTPGIDRQRPYAIEFIIKLPPNVDTLISVDFERSLLKWSEYPPDANKGFYVGSALISTVLPANLTTIEPLSEPPFEGKRLLRIFTEPILVSLPTPDFSMPYNVICLACTVVVLAFGPLHSITIGKLVAISGENPGKLAKILKKLKSFLPMK